MQKLNGNQKLCNRYCSSLTAVMNQISLELRHDQLTKLAVISVDDY